MEKGTAVDKASKVRSLLASYYTTDLNKQSDPSVLDVGEDRSGSPSRLRPPVALSPTMARPGSGGSATPLNASYFDNEAYLKRLVREHRLGELTSQHRELVAEVGGLDSDMQMLVYENYNKFITATDIVKLMNGEMVGLDGRIRSLEGLMGGVVERSYSINGKIEQRQESIMELNQARALLHKLQALLEVPSKLRAAIERGALDVAVDTYAQVAPVLAKHGQRTALKKVAAEVEACRAEVASRLRGQLLARPEGAAESIQMIAKLDEPTESLCEDFLECQRKRMKAVLVKAEQELRHVAAAADLKRALERLDSDFISELLRTAALFGKLFDPAGRPLLVKEAREALQHYLQLVRHALSGAATAAAEAAAGRNGVGIGEDWGSAALLGALGVVRGDLPRLETLLPELSSRDKASELVGNAVRQHVGACFAALEARVIGEVGALRAELAAAGLPQEAQGGMQAGLRALQALLMEGSERVMSGLGEYGRQRWALEGWQDVFVGLVDAQMESMLLSLPRRFSAEAGLASSSEVAPFGSSPPGAHRSGEGAAAAGQAAATGLMLVLSHACTFMDRHLVPRMPAQLEQLTAGGRLLQSHGMDCNNAGQVRLQLSTAASTLLQGYSAAQGGALAADVRKVVDATRWHTHAEPRGPSAAPGLLLDRLAAVDADLGAAESAATEAEPPTRPRHSRHNTGSASLEGSHSSGSSLVTGSASLAALPQQQQQHLHGVGDGPGVSNRADIVAAVLHQALRAQTAALRRHTLNPAGFQQCQLDCHFLRPQLQRIVAGAGSGAAALQALEEVLLVAAQRCREGAVLLEPAVIDRLIAEAQQAQTRGRA